MHCFPFRDTESYVYTSRIAGCRGAPKRNSREFKFLPRKDSITVRISCAIPPGNKPAAVVSRSATLCNSNGATLFYLSSLASRQIGLHVPISLRAIRLLPSFYLFDSITKYKYQLNNSAHCGKMKRKHEGRQGCLLAKIFRDGIHGIQRCQM